MNYWQCRKCGWYCADCPQTVKCEDCGWIRVK